MWIKIDKKANLFNMDVYIAVCYMPPKTDPVLWLGLRFDLSLMI